MRLLSLLLQVGSAFLGVVSLAVLFHVPKKYLLFAGLTGAGGWLVELIAMNRTGNAVMTAFLSASFVAVLSQLLARIFKAPVTVYLIPGILPLVPGVGMYRMVYYLLQENGPDASYYFSYTLQVAGMIALAVFLVDSCFKVLYRKKK